MNHSERFQLAGSICTHLDGLYPGQIIVGGVYGSTVRGTDTPWSDLELWLGVQDGCPAKSRDLLFRGVSVVIRVMAANELENTLTHPGLEWPFTMGVLSELRVLTGDSNRVTTWVQTGCSLPDNNFRIALEEVLPGLVTESYGRIHSCALRANPFDLRAAIWEVLFEMRTDLCLLNHTWVTHDYYQGQIDTFQFPLLPDRFVELVPALYGCDNFEEAVTLSDDLVTGFWKLITEQGIQVHNYQFVGDIRL